MSMQTEQIFKCMLLLVMCLKLTPLIDAILQKLYPTLFFSYA